MSDEQPGFAALESIRRECIELGLVEGGDFHVEGFPTGLSSEYVDLRLTSGCFEIRYSDMGQPVVVARTDRADRARFAFIEIVTRLAAGRNHGPRAGMREKVASWRDTMTEDQLIERFHRQMRLRQEIAQGGMGWSSAPESLPGVDLSWTRGERWNDPIEQPR